MVVTVPVCPEEAKPWTYSMVLLFIGCIVVVFWVFANLRFFFGFSLVWGCEKKSAAEVVFRR